MTLMLLMTHFLALGVGVMVFGWMFFLQRRNRAEKKFREFSGEFLQDTGATRPTTWLAVRSLEPEVVRAIFPDKEEFSVSPRVNGWVVVVGPGLPTPADDIDACFLFLIAASRHLGHVQYFHTEKISAHHAWARMDHGCVTRAYAWTSETVWNQGTKTVAEKQLGMKCPGYGEAFGTTFWATRENAVANMKKIPLLAARWSLDPENLPRTDGITGESSRLND
jgi:hypothetical protein